MNEADNDYVKSSDKQYEKESNRRRKIIYYITIGILVSCFSFYAINNYLQ